MGGRVPAKEGVSDTMGYPPVGRTVAPPEGFMCLGWRDGPELERELDVARTFHPCLLSIQSVEQTGAGSPAIAVTGGGG